jgi:hypothetical protein
MLRSCFFVMRFNFDASTCCKCAPLETLTARRARFASRFALAAAAAVSRSSRSRATIERAAVLDAFRDFAALNAPERWPLPSEPARCSREIEDARVV